MSESGGDEIKKELEDDCEAPEATECTKKTPLWYIQENRTRYLSDQFRQTGVMCLTLLSIVLCLVFFFLCPRCLFGILFLSLCLCPFFHPMNAPLWFAIILLTISGWSFTTGALQVSWHA